MTKIVQCKICGKIQATNSLTTIICKRCGKQMNVRGLKLFKIGLKPLEAAEHIQLLEARRHGH